MSSRVIAHGGFANRGVDNGIHSLPNTDCLLGNDLMHPHSLHRVVASSHFGDDSVVIVGVEPPAVTDLPAGLGVEGSVVENDLAEFAGLEFLRALVALDDGEHFTAVRARLTIAFERRFRELLVNRIGGLFGRAFPGGASAVSLLGHRTIEAFLIEGDALVASGVLHKVQRHAERVVELESVFPWQSSRALIEKLLQLLQANI